NRGRLRPNKPDPAASSSVRREIPSQALRGKPSMRNMRSPSVWGSRQRDRSTGRPTPAGSPYADHFAAIIPEKRHASKAAPAPGPRRRPDRRSPEPAPDRALVAALAGPADPFDRGAGEPAREVAVGPASLIWAEPGDSGQPSPDDGNAGRPGLVLADSAP